MTEILFLACLAAFLFNFLGWGFKHLPGERWQMLAVVPMKKNFSDSCWLGANLTYYGFFIATSQLIAFILLLILLGSASISLAGAFVVAGVILLFSLPAARIVAKMVEKKNHTFTIGGASFVGIIVAPWAIMGVDLLLQPYGISLPVIPLLAALSIAYTLGEGLGRLGCISYGCCYGKPIKECSPLVKFLFSKINFIFHGDTKKVTYEGKLNGEKLVPIQAITSVLYSFGALVGCYLFLKGRFTEALLLTMALTQIWRIFSEMFRADFRGFGKISAYQKMGLLSVLYIVFVVIFVTQPTVIVPSLSLGLSSIWNPAIIIGLQCMWFVFFYIFGRSSVTTSVVSFELIEENI